MLSSAVEHRIADLAVAGSIPAIPFLILKTGFDHSRVERVKVVACCTVPVAQLDKASDYESEDWGFKSLQG